jgi:hypothetical protein
MTPFASQNVLCQQFFPPGAAPLPSAVTTSGKKIARSAKYRQGLYIEVSPLALRTAQKRAKMGYTLDPHPLHLGSDDMRPTAAAAILILCMAPLWAGGALAKGEIADALSDALEGLDRSRVKTGILYDRVLPLSGIEDHDGGPTSRPVTLAGWRQAYHEMSGASLIEPEWPALESLLDENRRGIHGGLIPIAFMRFDYDRIHPDALEDGLLEMRDGRLVETGRGDPLVQSSVFAATALKDYTHRGANVAFVIDRARYFSNDERLPRRVDFDFDDGRGFRQVDFGGEQTVNYMSVGRKTIRIRAAFEDGTVLWGAFYFRVVSLQAPTPHDTLAITATIPYNSEFGTGEAYVYRSDANASLTLPAILVEGFDIDNSMYWDELYELTSKEGLVDSLRAMGYDAVVLNFTDGVDYIQKNAFVLVELIQQIQAMIAPDRDVVIVGASMGGLVTRYALSYMEHHSLHHRVRLFVSFDSPQKGANIPLGAQHWVDFFSGQSADAAALLEGLNSPAARQMLVYHHTKTPTTTAGPDPLKAGLEADLAAVGDYPAFPRIVAVANGSGTQTGQGFSPGQQIVSWEYSSFLVDIVGNVWAVSGGPTQQIFNGLIDIILLPKEEESISVTGTMPYDNAPGGYRSSMAQMDSTDAPYGDIVALYPNHCFIPTISALDLATDDLFYDIAGDTDILTLTPFAAVFVPATNQEHIEITSETVQWFVNEFGRAPTGIGVGPPLSLAPALRQNYPNPFNPVTTIDYVLPRSGHAILKVFSVDGRLVITLVDEPVAAGPHEAVWNGRDRTGQPVVSGIYFYRLQTGSYIGTRKMVLLK